MPDQEIEAQFIVTEELTVKGESDDEAKFGGKRQKLTIKDDNGIKTIRLANHGTIAIGGQNHNGTIYLVQNDTGEVRISAKSTNLLLIEHRTATGDFKEIIKYDIQRNQMKIDGDILVGNLGGNRSGHISVFNKNGDPTIDMRGDIGDTQNRCMLRIGGNGNNGDISVLDTRGRRKIWLSGIDGDIKLTGGDCAENFEVSEDKNVDPGSVVVFDDNEKIHLCNSSYNKRVAGIASGANGVNPGIILGNSQSENYRIPIALNGTAYCKVDASYSPIESGDLLTTSSTIGHAMKVMDNSKAMGAVIGKAIGSLFEGKGLIKVLVTMH